MNFLGGITFIHHINFPLIFDSFPFGLIMRPVSGPSPLCRSWTCILQRMPWTVSRIWPQQPWSHLLQAALLTRSCSSCCQPGTVSACHWHCCKRCQSAAWTFGQSRFPWPMQRKEHLRYSPSISSPRCSHSPRPASL